MTRKKTIVVIAAVVAFFAILAAVLIRQRVRRHRVFRPSAGEVKPAPPKGIPPVEQWTATFLSLQGEELAELLSSIEAKHPDLYKKYSLGYLHARALIEDNEESEALRRLEPFLAKDHPFRDRALYHRASLAEGAEASRFRNTLIFEHRGSMYRDEAIDDELEFLTGKPQELLAFAEKIAPSASTERRREINARIVEATGSLDRGLAVLKGGIGDDAADRVTRALDKPAITQRLSTEQLELFGETFQRHRHYDRAIAYLNLAIGRLTPKPPAKKAAMLAAAKKKKKAPAKTTKKAPAKASKKKTAAPPKPAPPPVNPRKRIDELEFALGRSYFGAERYAEAQNIYLRGARATPDPGTKCMFLWHAARSAQLRGDDKTAEALMTQSIAVKGKFPSTTAALTQRIRTRLEQRRFNEAASDLVLLRGMAGNTRATLEGSLAYAVGMLAAGNTTAALSALNSVPPSLRDDYDDAEFAYWRARALEQRDPPAAFRAYLEVLRSDAPSHFAYFARKRLDAPAMAAKLANELALREQQVAKHVAAKEWDLARRIQTDRVLLSSKDRANQLRRLADIYRQLPVYQDVLVLKPAELPSFPNADGPEELLMAMGLHDEAAETIEQRWGLRPARAALTRSHALNLGGASKQSIYAIEVMMKAVPADFHPELLPEIVRRLLYPRYFYEFIAGDAKRYEADPTLVLSIMREESRFNPRAKSQAAARGLLQFIITTARDIGRDVGLVDVDPEDLYDPRVIIRLGAKYIAELSEQFGGNRYRAAAAYNAGPKQVALWNRIQAGDGDDYFLTAVNFDETKHYVRKVMNSYERYRSIYGDAAPVGGLRVEP
ncbi:MAG TPA: transglycosylase SLT domain-containing protein [Thermoanaerobaculia bacterium]